MKNYLLLLSFFLSINIVAQDTVVVQTFTFDSTSRDAYFEFPTDDHNTYEKVLMQYRMRCKGAQVSNSSDRNKGCGEWDYSCNTYISDTTKSDSIKATHPSHIVSNFTDTTFNYTATPTYDLIERDQQHTEYTTTNSENNYTVNNGSAQINAGSTSLQAQRYQFLYTSTDLQAAGVTVGDISGLKLPLINATGTLSNLRVSLKESSAATLDQSNPDFTGFTEVFYENTSVVNGDNFLRFYQNFTYNGTSNILVEISYDVSANSTANFTGLNTDNSTAIYANSGGYIEFDGAGFISFKNIDFQQVQNNISFSFWCYGDGDFLGTSNSTIFEGVDVNEVRQVNSHLPWSNKNVYWDCGNDGSGVDRVEKNAPASSYANQWNHWVFTKDVNAGTMTAYHNGSVFMSGTAKNKAIDIFQLNIGASYAAPKYYGYINDFRVFNNTLSASDAAALMNGNETTINTLASNELIHLQASTSGIQENSLQNNPFTEEGLVHIKKVFGNKLIHNFKDMPTPTLTFVQGDYVTNTTTVAVYDTIFNKANQIESYGIANNEPAVTQTAYGYSNATSFVYDEDGNEVSSSENTLESTLEITDLEYFRLIPSSVEIMSFVTPYGIGLNLGQDGKMWEFDVSDFSPILKGTRRVYLTRGGQNQEEMDIRFLFIKGTPERDILDFRQIWPVSSASYQSLLDQSQYEPRDIPVNAAAKFAKVKSVVTGHGQEGEFIARNHFINVNSGQKTFNWNVWTECATNPIFPQGGTWVFDRAGWCPGAPSDMAEYDVTPYITPGQNLSIDYGVSSATGDSRYIVSNQFVAYGAYNFGNNAAIEHIIKPSMRTEYDKFNTSCTAPEIRVKNRGANTITSLEIDYWVDASNKETYTWNGNILASEEATVSLPLPNASFWENATNNTFSAEITGVNGGADEYTANNIYSSVYNPVDIIQAPFVFRYKTNDVGYEYSYTIKDIDGNIIKQADNLANNELYTDTLDLPSGCYSLEWLDEGDDGLDFWYWAAVGQSRGTGYLRFNKMTGFSLKNFNGDYGRNVLYDFTVQNTTSVSEANSENYYKIFPNPSSGNFTIYSHSGFNSSDVIIVRDITGKIVSKTPVNSSSKNETLNLTNLAKGMYTVTLLQDVKNAWSEKIMKF